MKHRGIIRKLDELGRIVIAKEIRTILNMFEGDSIEMHIENNKVILEKYESGCIFCETTKNLIDYKSKKICNKCIIGQNSIIS